MTTIRQGDIFLKKVARVPAGYTEAKRDDLGRIVLARGEAHDHTHAIRDRNICAFRMIDGADEVAFIEVGPAGGLLTHEYSSGAKADHEPVALGEGVYQVVRQREYVAPQIERRVAD